MKKHLGIVIKVLISVGILYFLFRGMDLQAFLKTIVSVKPSSVIITIIMIFCVQCLSSLRWQIILKKDLSVPFRKLLSMYLIGMFFNNFLPTLVGGDLIKTYYLYKQSGKGSVALASIFLDRYSGFTALITITTIALIFGNTLLAGTGFVGFFIILIAGYTGASLVIWIDFLHRWVMNIMSKIHFYGLNKKIDEFYKVLMGYKSHKEKLFKSYLLSLVIQFSIIVAYFLLGWGIGMDIPFGYYCLFIPLATVASMVPITFGGLGVREGIFIYLFTTIGAAQEEALTLSLLFFFVQLAVSLLGGIEYVRIGGKKAVGVPDDIEEKLH